ncbi:MAG: hypothetical protein QOK28_2542 [Actinomycetota bacterium]
MSIHTSTDSLERLVQMLDFDLGDVDELPTGDSAQIVRVTSNSEIALKSLDGEHPFDALIGFDAPPEWEVFGVVAPGWGTYYEGPRKGERRRVRAIFVASRRGEEASLLRFAGDDKGIVMREPQSAGRVADCVRRALDIPTAPAANASLVAYWFDRVLQKLAARRHPSARGRGLVDVDEIDELIDGQPMSWEDERWRVVQAEGNLHMDGAVAAWMDAGMFARFMLAEMADPAESMRAAKPACTPEAWTYLLQCFLGAATEIDDDIEDVDAEFAFEDEDEPF